LLLLGGLGLLSDSGEELLEARRQRSDSLLDGSCWSLYHRVSLRTTLLHLLAEEKGTQVLELVGYKHVLVIEGFGSISSHRAS